MNGSQKTSEGQRWYILRPSLAEVHAGGTPLTIPSPNVYGTDKGEQ
jgi:hypothetical protein